MCMKRQREETYQIFFCWRAQNRIKFQLHQTSLLCYPYNPSAPLSMRACLLDVCYAILRSYFCKTPKCKGGEGDVSMAGLNICSSGGYLSATLTTPALILVLFSHLFFCVCVWYQLRAESFCVQRIPVGFDTTYSSESESELRKSEEDCWIPHLFGTALQFVHGWSCGWFITTVSTSPTPPLCISCTLCIFVDSVFALSVL